MTYSDRTPAGPRPGGMSLPRILALVVGVVYTLIGLAGFVVTGFDNFASENGDSLLGFEVNPLHNVVHLLTGVLGLVMARRLATARTYGWILFVAYAAVFIYGLFAGGDPDADILALNGADHVLHLLTALVGLAIALWPVRGEVRAGADERAFRG
ncbi:MAG TPA: DUF4383 domain-containing protein [Micromonosporaceae bacterium]|nr:DUF4383 domain-containing protein [Micromonosporaceae bacterium]